ncbi:TIGR02452 family protein [Actinoplanes sp. NPDC051851]|uniref:TIGR02452 family protein n=1 Tax=Actinoplanes sp. NPDC051851 TaxID=3154753 RepID=UPI00343E31EA
MSARLRALGREAVEIAERGSYSPSSGSGDVLIGERVRRAVDGTRLHLPGDVLADGVAGTVPVRIEVTGETSLAAARRLGDGVACLNFASARNPGGGFLKGAQAQEESLARSSALYPCLLAAGDFYRFHRGERSLLYTDRVIYAPQVPVFRDDRGALIESYPVSFLVSAAPNRAAIAREQPGELELVPAALARRADRVLRVAAAHGHRRLVLGAWGCGVFGNDPEQVAGVFRDALAGNPYFEHVVFAVLDRGGATRAAFERSFTTGATAG